MAKRLVSPNSDDEDAQDASPASKRARTDGGSDIEQNNRSQRRRAQNKGKGRAHGEDGDSSSDDDQEPEAHANHIDDDQFEEQYHERVEKAVDAKRHIVGGVAEHGIIESIEMHQFMCHRFLSFQFGPQINFIIGHNGSGKSAVLSAITIALGGKSNSTGRGSGLKSFIREGQSAAEVTIALKNQGEEAYKPHEYGKSIFITRRFTKEGSSTWKIRGSKSNHTVSSKREELSAICDHMNIQVDNPMNVLTQDAARQFLSASAPADKYKFFLRGTQLSQLATEYETCYENITNTTKVLENKKEAIPDLKQAFCEATAKYQEAAQALKQKAKAKELKTELAWSHVRVKERDLQSKMEDVEHAKRHREKIEESLNAARVKLQKAGENVAKHEEEINAVGNIADLDRRKSEFKTEMKSLKSQIQKCSSDMKEINTSTTAAKNSIQDLERNIAAETQRSAKDTQEKRDEFTRRMDEARATVAEQERIIQQLSAAKLDILRRAQSAEQDGQAKQAELEQLKQNIGTVENSLRQLQRDQDNKYAAYGPGMAQVVARIQQTKWYGDEPLGPLGRYVKVKDPDAWADLLAQQLGGSLTSFAVTDPRDRDSLKRLLDQANLKHNQIIIFEKDRFDFSAGEPAPDVLTVLRAVEIEDEDVKRILINQARIETLILAPTRKEAEHVLRRVGGGVAWTQDRFNVKRFCYTPEVRDSTLVYRALSYMHLRRHLEVEHKQLDAQYESFTAEVQRFRTTYMALKQEESQNMQNSRRANSILTGANQKIRNLLQEANEDTPVNIQGLQEAKLEVEQERDTYIKQFEDVARTKAQLEQTLGSLTEEELALRAEINSFNDRLAEIRARVDAAVEARMNAQRAVQHYEKKRHESNVAIEAAETILKTTTEEFESWTNSASEIGDRVETNRKPGDIQRQMDNVKNALQEREKRHHSLNLHSFSERQGATVDQIIKEVNTTKEKLERAQKDYKQMLQLNKILRASLAARLSRWQEFRRHIALRCKMVFRYNLSQRGYFGNILFNHSEQTLSLKVQTDDQLSTQDGSKEKDPRSLSGGEKSFSTICLLLSLWESIGCPLRCLDEFDVFMDAVNRRISMKMMIDTANQSDKKQYILITPQDMNNITIGPTVRVHRMTDPERGQGILAMG
ncbi:P-loop containing nucleoside triphosphate hydrolase protein [Lentinula aff. lateritia]|uniref:P-loop containing nucleoside triphosphate hydrolase protein n=1 Tax=Lentinula aff. lateritia TaxID=2804960 RepID=A0ACC1UAQ1_9AGAR|nr:P-loop containing nucleoside triphosphate hydrolase protein [Lentinula aff. lateritia]